MFDKRVVLLLLCLTACGNSKVTYCEKRDEPFIDEVIFKGHFDIVDEITIVSKIDLNQIDISDELVDEYLKASQMVLDKYSNISLIDGYIVKTQKYSLKNMLQEDIKQYISDEMCENCYIGYEKTIQQLKYQGFYCANQ